MRAVEKTGADWAREAYEGTAPAYDDFTAHHRDEEWITDLLVALEDHGLRGHRLLDVGCGTGKSFLPMLPRDWDITGCDILPSMLAFAREKAGKAVRLVVANMLALPRFGSFDLVWALDDTINYMLNTDELERALGMRENLAGTGLLLFDANTLLAYRTFFSETTVIEQPGRRLVWHGLAAPGGGQDSIFESRLEMGSSEQDAGSDEPTTVVHRQRHFSQAEILASLERVGLECLAVWGIYTDGIRQQPLDELIHTKAIYIARIRQGENQSKRSR
jgi:SAM-dependent methyltransferase